VGNNFPTHYCDRRRGSICHMTDRVTFMIVVTHSMPSVPEINTSLYDLPDSIRNFVWRCVLHDIS
jgi:hypothetical protein